MVWVYRNVMPGRIPPCPVCDCPNVEKPEHPAGKYRCPKCGASFQSAWKQQQDQPATREAR